MTNTVVATPSVPLLEAMYTTEELAILAELLDLSSLPGIDPIDELAPDVRSLATRCLIARRVLVLPDSGGVEVVQPHSALLATMLDSNVTYQVTRFEDGVTAASTWFELDGSSVRVGADDEGIVSIAYFDHPALHALNAAMGIAVSGELDTAADAESIIELIISTRSGEDVASERSVIARVHGRWLKVKGA